MAKFITSDWHFFHNNACGPEGFISTRKKFSSVEEMNDNIIKTINQKVSRDDTIIHLGDIGFGKPKKLFETLEKINGQIILIKGNHDSSKLFKYIVNNNYHYPYSNPKKHKQSPDRVKFLVEEVGLREKMNGKVYYLTHYPFQLGEQRKNMRSICGHIHEQIALDANMINVGIDSPEITSKISNFGEPLLLEDAVELVDKKWEKWYNDTIRILGS